MTADLVSMFASFSSSYGAIYSLMMNFCIVAGFTTFLFGLNRMRMVDSSSRQHDSGPVAGLWGVGIGAGLIYLPSLFDSVTATLFNASSSEFGYASFTATSDPMGPIRGFLKLFGLYAFIRGMYIAKEVGQGDRNKSFSSAITHIVSGMLLVNLKMTLTVISATFGVTVFATFIGGG